MITVFTSVYNRSNLISNLYKSLINQTSYDFEWIVIDDGSTDNIEYIIQRFINEGKICIKYIRQEHGGKHRAINQIDDIAQGEAIVFVDSDDILLENAIESFISLFHKIQDKDNVIAAAAMMVNLRGTISGKCKVIKESIDITWRERYKHGLDGEYCYIFKRGVWKQYPLPEYDGEYFASEAISMLNMSKDNKLISFHDDVLYKYEYQNDGLSKNLDKLYKNNPKGYAHLCYAWTNKQDDYSGYIEACRNFYEVCIDEIKDNKVDDILHIKQFEKDEIMSKIELTLNSIKQMMQGNVGIYGYGYYGHKIRRYMDMINGAYVLIDQNADNINIDSVFKMNDYLPRLDTIIVCIKNKEWQREVQKKINIILPGVKIVNLDEIYME